MIKHWFFILMLTATIAEAQTQIDSTKAPNVNEALDSRYGFLGNKFDAPFSSYKGLFFIKDYRGYKVYKKAVDIKSYSKAKITSIQYSFYRGLLAAVQVKAENNLENEEAWRELLKAAYGPAQDSVETKESEDMEYHNYGGNYLWHGLKAGINLSIHLGDPISIYVYSAVADERKRKDEAAALKRAAQKL